MALAGFEAVNIGGKNGLFGKETGPKIGHGNPAFDRRPVVLARHGHNARHTLGHEIKAAFVRIRAGCAKAGYRSINEAGLLLLQPVIAQAESGHHSRTIILHHRVSLSHQCPGNILGTTVFEIEHNTALVPVDRPIAATLHPLPLPHAPGSIAARRLDLNNIGPQVPKKHGAKRPGHHLGKFQDADSRECLFHIFLSFLMFSYQGWTEQNKRRSERRIAHLGTI